MEHRLGRLLAALTVMPLLAVLGTSGASADTAGDPVRSVTDPRPAHDRDPAPTRERPTDDGRDGPTYGSEQPARVCSERLCVYWVESGPSAVAGDGDLSTMPALVRAGRAAAEDMLTRFVAAGWRLPKPDDGRGGDDRLDLYFVDLSGEEADGQCRTDEPRIDRDGFTDAWSFCLIDNDFGGAEQDAAVAYVPAVVAHELFHAIQGAYDWYDDPWFGEATAMWAEATMTDEPGATQYGVEEGPVGSPSVPMDKAIGYHHYGAWTFFRFLEQEIPDRTADVSDLVLEMWERADASRQRKHGNEYSMQAVVRALEARGEDFVDLFARYHAANRDTHANYEGAAEWDWPSAPDGSFRPRRGWQVTKLDHLTSATLPVPAAAGSDEVVIRVKMAKPARGSAAVVTRYARSGTSQTMRLDLNRKGKGGVAVPLSSDDYTRVDVVLVNASTRYRDCHTGSRYSCEGVSRDDGLRAKVKVRRS